jgi:hypothetical protein
MWNFTRRRQDEAKSPLLEQAPSRSLVAALVLK